MLNIKLEKGAKAPVRAHPTDAGADLFANVSCTLYPEDQYLVDTGVCVEIPPGFVGLVFNRSSQGKLGITIPHSVGVIDSDYRGTIKVLLSNNSYDYVYHIEAGVTRIAQLVIVPIALPEFNVVNELSTTARGTGGFGSTG